MNTSTKAVNTDLAAPGDVLTYTIILRNTGNMNAWVAVQDVMPIHTTYVPNSLDYNTGTGGYDTFNNWIWWEGVVIAPIVTIDPGRSPCGDLHVDRLAARRLPRGL